MSKKIWMYALALFLGLYAVLALTNIKFELQNVIMGVIAAVTAVFLVLDR